MKKIRFFNTYEPVTDFYRDLLPELAHKGLASIVYLSRTEYRRGRIPLEAALKEFPVTTRRMFSVPALSSGRLSKLIASISFAVLAAVMSLFERKVSLNVFLTQPPLFGIWGSVLKRVKHQPYICVLMDIYPDCAIAAVGRTSKGWLEKLLVEISRASWRSADKVVCIGRCMQDLVIAEGVDPSRVVTIPNWADTVNIWPISRGQNHLRAKNDWISSFIVLYSGNMGVAHVFDGILEAAHSLASNRDIQFVFVGDGARRKQIADFCNVRGLTNVHFMHSQSSSDLAYSQGLGDIHVVTLGAPYTGLMVPSKAYSALAAGRPMLYLGSPAGEIARLIAEEDVGVVLDPRDGAGIKDAILGYYVDNDKLTLTGERARRLALGRCSRVKAAEMYACEFVQLMEGPGTNTCNGSTQ